MSRICCPTGERLPRDESGEGLAELDVLGVDGGRLVGDEGFEEEEEAGGVEGFEGVIGGVAVVDAGGADGDDGQGGVLLLEAGDEVGAGHVAHAGVKDDAADVGELVEGGEGFLRAVGGDGVELRGLDDELARGYARGVLAIDDKEAGPDHG